MSDEKAKLLEAAISQIEKQHGKAVTSAMLGAFRHNKQPRDEFLSLVRRKID